MQNTHLDEVVKTNGLISNLTKILSTHKDISLKVELLQMLDAIAAHNASADVASALTQTFSSLNNFVQTIVDAKDQEYRIYSVALLNQIAKNDANVKESVKAALEGKVESLEQGASANLVQQLNNLK